IEGVDQGFGGGQPAAPQEALSQSPWRQPALSPTTNGLPVDTCVTGGGSSLGCAPPWVCNRVVSASAVPPYPPSLCSVGRVAACLRGREPSPELRRLRAAVP